VLRCASPSVAIKPPKVPLSLRIEQHFGWGLSYPSPKLLREPVNTRPPNPLMMTRRDIRNEFNWSDSMIQKYLGKPDDTRFVRLRCGRRGTQFLYLRERVEAAMQAPGFEPKRVQIRRTHTSPNPEPAVVEEKPQEMFMYIEGQKPRRPPKRKRTSRY
jgi:hypothetical protein